MDYMIGDIVLFATSYSPEYFFDCKGQQLEIRNYQALYSLIGINFGGDGRTYFNLPNLMGSEPHPELRYCICWNGTYPERD